jgi:uncharacterized membrane protein
LTPIIAMIVSLIMSGWAILMATSNGRFDFVEVVAVWIAAAVVLGLFALFSGQRVD